MAVNRCPDVIDGAIAKANGIEHGEAVQWLSPLESDAFTEYKDHAFLERLGITPPYHNIGTIPIDARSQLALSESDCCR